MADSSSGARFPTTHWSCVVRAGDPSVPGARKAIEELCRAYWFPLYAFVRRQGNEPEAAADLVQGLFVKLMEHNALAAADAGRGRFRTFLLAACRNYLADCRKLDRAQKRGGGRAAVSIDSAAAEGSYSAEPVDHLTPERLYERDWALSLLQRVLSGMRREYENDGKAALFARLEPTLAGGPEALSHAAIAAALGMTEEAVQVAAYRLRRRYRRLLRAEIAATVADPADVDDEIRALFAALGS
jgi:RNA polymerase sigma-70 factor (ECF subfamily)